MKWDKAVARLVKDRHALLTFHDFPAEHRKHIRTSNPIESPGLCPFRAELIHWIGSWASTTLRHRPTRTERTKGCLSRKTGLAMAFRLMMSAQKTSRKLGGQNRLPDIIQRVAFRDGLRHLPPAARSSITNFYPYLDPERHAIVRRPVRTDPPGAMP